MIKLKLSNLSLYLYTMIFSIGKTVLNQFSKIKRSDPIMLFASSPVGFPTLKMLNQYYDNLSVVTHYSNPHNKHTNQVDKYCQTTVIPCFFPVKRQQTKQQRAKQWDQFIGQVKKMEKKPVLGVVCAYGYMIPDNVIDLFEKGMILAHPSLIPKYRGGSPIFHTIANGEKQTGISFLEVSKNKFDHGNLLHQIKCEIGQKDTYQKIQKQLADLIAEEIVNVIQNVDTYRPGKKQSEMDVSGIPPQQLQAKIHKDKHLNINMTAEQVYNWSRALVSPRVKFNDQEIIVFFEKVFEDDPSNEFKPGQIRLKGKNLFMKCSDKFIKLAGWQEITKKPLAIHTFINRHINKQKYKNQIFFK